MNVIQQGPATRSVRIFSVDPVEQARRVEEAIAVAPTKSLNGTEEWAGMNSKIGDRRSLKYEANCASA